ncbi:atrial natriuretic peptide receptor 1-like [Gigantopelta aegis]|uniref:atrial natriuretic peptide receptor 1-like n=1 Tax=Gigantopelta aegis TaxID=1735272 RepID=UPI001B88A5B7|nr:atrial natriuretic peptide receptor 1-like [Gigantopelta aegis]
MTRMIVICIFISVITPLIVPSTETMTRMIVMHIYFSTNALDRPWHRANDTDARNEKARKAYEALMTITIRKPTSPEFTQFSEEVKRTASELYPNVSYGDGQVNSFVGAFYDAVILYGLALNETLAANGNVSDGSAITQRMWNRTFEGITGMVYIDENGDRDSDFSLLDMDPQTGKFEVVANYYGVQQYYEPVPGKSIHWAGGRVNPPPDTPECGFDGSRCRDKEYFPTYAIVLLVLGSAMLVVLVTLLSVYRARFRDVLQRWCTGRSRDHMTFRLR